jgi:adenylate kinase
VISVGDEIRKLVKSNSEIGNIIYPIITQGDLVPDNIVSEIITSRVTLPDYSNGFISDGTPRTISQYLSLLKAGVSFSHVIVLEVPNSTLINRVKKRSAIQKNRADDSLDIFMHRMEIYKNFTTKLINLLQSIEKNNTTDITITVISGQKSVEQVHQEIMASLKKD